MEVLQKRGAVGEVFCSYLKSHSPGHLATLWKPQETKKKCYSRQQVSQRGFEQCRRSDCNVCTFFLLTTYLILFYFHYVTHSINRGSGDSEDEDEENSIASNEWLAMNLIDNDMIELEINDVIELSDEDDDNRYTSQLCQETLAKVCNSSPP
jgi:hypothetical protein